MQISGSEGLGTRLRRLTLGTKLSLGIVAVIAAATLGVASKASSATRDHLVEEKRAAATAFTDLFAASIAPAVDFGDEEALRVRADHFRSRDDALELLVWTKDRRTPVLSSDESGATKPLPVLQDAVAVLPDRVVVTRPVASPAGRVGAVQLAFSLERENESAALARQRILLGAVLLGTVLALGWRGVPGGRTRHGARRRGAASPPTPRRCSCARRRATPRSP